MHDTKQLHMQLRLAMVSLVIFIAVCVAEANQEGAERAAWTPDMCSGPDRPSLWLNNKPLVNWCYQNGNVVPETASGDLQAASREDATPRAGNAMVFDVTNPVGTVIGGTFVNNDDSNTGRINFPPPLRLFGEDKNFFWINNNGLISLTAAVGSYTSNGFQQAQQPLFGPYWADVDTRGTCPANDQDCNKVIWRISSASNNAADLTTARDFLGKATLPDFVLIVTWNKVGYFSGRTDKLNTLQVMVAKFGTQTALGYFYDQLQWTTGGASGGVNGLGGFPAYAGLSGGTSTSTIYFNVPGSGTNDVLTLTARSGGTAAVPGGLQPGQWVWDTLAGEGCSSLVPNSRECGKQCLSPDQCCTQPNDCPSGAQCPSDGGKCPFVCTPGVGCCTGAGQFAPDTTICRPATECTFATYCSGQSATCPSTRPFDEGIPCNTEGLTQCLTGLCSTEGTCVATPLTGQPCTMAYARVWYTDDPDWVPEDCDGVFTSWAREKMWARTCTGSCTGTGACSLTITDLDGCFTCRTRI